MNAEKIKELRGLVAEATQGPWAIYPEQTGCEIFGGDSATLMHFCRPPRELAANSAAIVALFNAAPALLDEVEALTADAERYRYLRNDPPITLCVRMRHESGDSFYLDGGGLDRQVDAALAARHEPKDAEHG